MAMTGAGMAAAVEAALQAAFPNMTAQQITQLANSMTPFCSAIVAYIQANAVVTVTGVQTGIGSATGTIG